MRLQTLPLQQPSHQMLIDGAQCADSHTLSKLVEHPGRGQRAPQPGEASPRGLFGQLRHEEIERMSGGQYRQQMRAPQLSRTQRVPPPTRRLARTNLGDEVIGSVGTQQFKKMAGDDRRQNQTHARTLTHTPLVSASLSEVEPVTNTFVTPSASKKSGGRGGS